MMNVTSAILFSLFSVIPPLSQDQRATFESVQDRTALVDDAFYALLQNASLWLPDDEPAGAGLNVAATLASPAEYRGLPMVIEGEYLGLHEVHMVKRSGPWDGRLEQWGIRIPSQDAAVMVFLVNPPPVPVVGQKVQLVGRFYKVWPVTDERSGRKLEYLVFIGHTARVSAGRALPPLTESDQRGLTSIVDFTEDIDRGPFYQLLHNAMQVKDQPMPAAPLITHPDPILGAPREYRGLPLRVEGTLARRQIFEASREGPWKKIEQWVIQITPKTRDKPGESIIVYLADAPDTIKEGDKVSVVGRFYKIWRTYLAKGEMNEPYNFVVMVGHRAEPIDKLTETLASQSSTTTGGSSAAIPTAVGAALMLGVGYFLIRRRLKLMSTAGPAGTGLRAMLEKRREQRETQTHSSITGNGDTLEEIEGPPLPPDPVEALLEMERRRLPEE